MNGWLRSKRLMNYKQAKNSGYTVLEVLIVLSVSTALFFSISMLFSRRQAEIAFNQAVRGFETQIQNMISEVVNGYYPATGRRCSPSGGKPIIVGGNADPGTNEDCIFVGKVWASGTTTSQIFTVLANRLTGGVESSDLATTEIRQINRNEAIQTFRNNYSLRISKVLNLADTNQNVAYFGFFFKLSGGIATNSSASAKSAMLYAIPNSTPHTGDAPMPDAIQGDDALDSIIPLNNGLVMCVEDIEGRKAEIRIGENGTQTGMVSILNVDSGVCAT